MCMFGAALGGLVGAYVLPRQGAHVAALLRQPGDSRGSRSSSVDPSLHDERMTRAVSECIHDPALPTRERCVHTG